MGALTPNATGQKQAGCGSVVGEGRRAAWFCFLLALGILRGLAGKLREPGSRDPGTGFIYFRLV